MYLVCFCPNNIAKCRTCQYTMMYFLQFIHHFVLLQVLISTSLCSIIISKVRQCDALMH
nr:MAG TPA: hypothetical protein [Caudoviricetes sp.]